MNLVLLGGLKVDDPIGLSDLDQVCVGSIPGRGGDADGAAIPLPGSQRPLPGDDHVDGLTFNMAGGQRRGYLEVVDPIRCYHLLGLLPRRVMGPGPSVDVYVRNNLTTARFWPRVQTAHSGVVAASRP
jgi:hypothetical protein